jgi:hypothetical protein
MLRAMLVLTAALGCFNLATLAQPAVQPADKKADTAKGKDDAGKSTTTEPGKSKAAEKTAETGKDAAKAKIPLEKLLTPSGAIIVVVEELREVSMMFPKMILLTPEQYQELMERLKTLERQVKPENKVPSICKLSGRLEGDFLVFRAEYVFSTEAPKTTVLLGLQGGHLVDEGTLDGRTPILEYTKEDGFVVQVEKAAPRHELNLNFRVPIRKSPLSATERGIVLGLPGASTTIVNLDLPNQVRELRWNETLEKRKMTGGWVISPDKSNKTLSFAWKEPLSPSGNAPLAKANGEIKVDIDEKDIYITAELTLDDSRLQTKDWRLLLPPQASVEVTHVPGGLTYEWTKPDKKTPYHILRTSDATAESWKVTVTMHVPRPNPGARVAIGPFQVLDAFEHVGTIAVTMKADVSFGQRLVYTRSDKTFQKSGGTQPKFFYRAPLVTEKNLKSMQVKEAPLELEWKSEITQLETQVEHALKLRTTTQGWEIDATTRIHVKTLFSALHFVDLKLPHPRWLAVVDTTTPGLAFPASVPWAGIWKLSGRPYADEFDVFDEKSGTPLKLVPQDATGKMRALLERSPAPKEITLLLKYKVRVPAPHQHVRLELPRPLGTRDRGAKLSIQTDKGIELLHGPEGAEEPVPDRDHFDVSWDQAPSLVDLAWKPYRRDVVAHSTIDITLHERTAQVKQTLQFPRDPAASGPDPKNPQISLHVPRAIDHVTVVSGGKIIQHDPARQTLWLRPSVDGDKVDLVLQYDLDIADTHSLDVKSIWPTNVSQKDVKVRVWSSTGITARLSAELANRGMWKERSIEKVEGVNQFPLMVLRAFGSDLRLSLKIENAATTTPAAFLAERALIQVRVLNDGGQECRARYLIHRIQAPHVDIELPRFRDPPTFTVGKKALNFEMIDAGDKIRVKLYPDLVALPAVLEIKYTIPADALERNSFWRTTMHGPVFHSAVVIREMRWQLTTTKPMLAASLERNAQAFVQWSWQSWLPTPESSVTSADWVSWLTAKDASQPTEAVTFSFAHITMQPETVYHLSRESWLLGCSGILLIVTLGGFFSPLPRLVFWLLLLGLALAILTLGIFWPEVAPIAFGSQPGVVLFLVFVGVHWLLQERYRRQLVFLPGFSRTKLGSTLVRTNAAKRPREASTVDAPGSEAPAEGAASKPSSSSS